MEKGSRIFWLGRVGILQRAGKTEREALSVSIKLATEFKFPLAKIDAMM
jgi:hypothetical protein